MKFKFLLSIILTTIGLRLAAQTIPVGFKNPRSQLFKNISVLDTIESAADSVTGKINSTVKNLTTSYKVIAERFRKTSLSISDSAEKNFIISESKLSHPKTTSEIKIYLANLNSLEDIRAVKRKEAKDFMKQAKIFEYLNRTSGVWAWLPVKNSIDAEMYYNGIIKDQKAKFLSNSLLSFSSDGGKASLFNELYADYFGPIRMGFGVLISNKQQVGDPENVKDLEAKREDAMQRLLGGGGNGVINLGYPLFNIDNGNGFAVKFGLAPKFGLDIPKIGTEKNDYAVNYNLGAEGTIFYSGALDIFTIYSNFRFAGIGGNGVFYSNLDKLDRKFFGFNQISIGLGFTSSFRLSYNYYFGSSYVNKTFPSAISFTIIPN